MAKEVSRISEDVELTEEDFAEVADLAEETPQVMIEEALDMIEAEEAEIFSAPEAEVEVEVTPAVVANPARVRAEGGFPVARSSRRP